MTPVVSAEIAWKGQDLARCVGRCFQIGAQMNDKAD
jgi:hypothetical protein